MFDPQANDADRNVLYEVTGFKARAEDYQFWETYEDFSKNMGGDADVGPVREVDPVNDGSEIPQDSSKVPLNAQTVELGTIQADAQPGPAQ